MEPINYEIEKRAREVYGERYAFLGPYTKKELEHVTEIHESYGFNFHDENDIDSATSGLILSYNADEAMRYLDCGADLNFDYKFGNDYANVPTMIICMGMDDSDKIGVLNAIKEADEEGFFRYDMFNGASIFSYIAKGTELYSYVENMPTWEE